MQEKGTETDEGRIGEKIVQGLGKEIKLRAQDDVEGMKKKKIKGCKQV